MRNKTYLWLAVGISLYTLAVVAEAQEEQWLRYRSAREARQILGNIGLQQVELSNDRPVAVELPQFKAENPLFGKLSTPIVGHTAHPCANDQVISKYDHFRPLG